MMKKCNYYKRFCSGCGMCSFDRKIEMKYKDGFLTPELTAKDMDFCSKYCISSYNPKKCDWKDSIWGNYKGLYYGYSTDSETRKRASSGGVITSICDYLLTEHVIDAIIHTGQDEEYPWRTKTYCTINRNELRERSGSRYAQSAPLKDVLKFVEKGKKYVYVGKPCDVYSLKKYIEYHEEYKESFYLTISFFCAGVPSENANLKLLATLGCVPDECKSISYRGNGWPGRAEVINKAGEVNSIDYQQSWGKILGRDIRAMCRFCMQGTGESADISCGDAWYLTEDRKPSFIEADGRNVIFGRTQIGDKVVLEAEKYGYLTIERSENIINSLRYSQPFQYERKATMFQKILAMRCMCQDTPNDNLKILFSIKSDISVSRKFEIFKGTIGRIVRRKI